MITATIVTYKNDWNELMRAMDSFLNTDMDVKLYIVDNSPTNKIKALCKDTRVEYIFMNSNRGFGAGHNIIMNDVSKMGKYHLVLNPDIYFEAGVLENIVTYMNTHRDIGLLTPKMYDEKGKTRNNRKLLPTPFNALFKVLLPFLTYTKKKESLFRTEFFSYDTTAIIPYLSGSFMFIRVAELKKVGTFDERFFMYFEDTDLSRRFYSQSKSVYYSGVEILHIGHRESHKKIKLAIIHINSAIKYFNKWGWRDKERNVINKKIIMEFSNNV